jgi:hypothetical protein
MPAPVDDVSQLMADLKAEAQVLPVRVTHPLELGQTLGDAYDQFQREWEQRVATAETQVEAARTTLAELQAHAVQVETSVREAMTSLDVVVDHHQEVIERELAELVQKMTAAGDSMNHLQSTLVTAGQDATNLAGEVEAAATELTAAAKAGQDQLQAAAAAVLQEVDALETEVRTASDAAAADLGAFAAALTAATAAARDELGRVLDQIGLGVRTHDGEVQGSATLVREGRAERRTQVEDGIARSVNTEVGEALQHADQALDALASRADGSADQAEASRPDLKEAIDKAADEGGKLEKAIGLIEETAGIVGLVWPG